MTEPNTRRKEFHEKLELNQRSEPRPFIRRRRTQLDIVVNLLQVASAGASKTALVYRSNLNFVMIQKYTKLLQQNGLLELFQTDRGSLYKTTAKGAEALKTISEAIGLVSESQPILTPVAYPSRLVLP